MSDKNIWEISTEEVNLGDYEKKQDADKYVLFTGGKGSGKTTALLQFLGRSESAKPTIALEYTFARRNVQLHNKSTGHFWELGGGTFLTKLLDIPISEDYINHFTAVIVLDLSQPHILWNTSECLLNAIRSRLDAVIQQISKKDLKYHQKLQTKAWKRIGGKDHSDAANINPFPVPLIIIGSKYDAFQNMESDDRKLISKTIRFLAHTNGGTLLFLSDKIDSTVRALKHVMNSAAFDSDLSKAPSMDEKKPMYIPCGMDSLDLIGNPTLSSSDISRMSAKNPLDLWRTVFCSRFPDKSENKSAAVDDPCKDAQFFEPMIDEARAQKDRELETYRRQEKNKWTRI